MDSVVLDKKDATDWIYRGEGGLNLVLAYAGSSSFFMGKVLRIRKAKRKLTGLEKSVHLSIDEQNMWKDIIGFASQSPARDMAEEMYVRNVMGLLLGPENVDAGVRVQVSKGFLESVEAGVRADRPLWRVNIAKVNLSYDSALLMSDHSLFPSSMVDEGCFSVEIKPKCGFLTRSPFICEQYLVKKCVSRFKMHQSLKLHNKEITEMSKYDPLDLFSGNHGRILKAVNALFMTPQNNLRVFVKGCTTVHPSEAISAENDIGLPESGLGELLTLALLHSKILDRLLETQMLDIVDIEGVIHAYYDVLSSDCLVCKSSPGNIIPDKIATIHSIPIRESVNTVRNFLIAATAKDCSLIISFRPARGRKWQCSSDSNYIYLDSTMQCFQYKAKFVDLDMKELEKIEHYYELDKRIVSHYIEASRAKEELFV